MNSIHNVLTSAIKEATDIAQKSLLPRKVSNKGSNSRDYVTELDLSIEKSIVDTIKKTFPDHSILSEESYSDINLASIPEHLWIIDPLDGTTNYVYGLYDSCISIAYAHNGVVEQAAVSDFQKNELYLASRGKGATLNGQKILVNTHTDLGSALLATDIRTDPKVVKHDLGILLSLPDNKLPLIRIGGSGVLQLCEVAAGRLDLYFHTKLKPWDKAASYLIVQEAGGVTKTLDGKDATFLDYGVIAGNQGIVKMLLKELAS